MQQIQIFVQRERLNSLASKEGAIVWTSWKHEEDRSKNRSRLEVGHKSNRMVLNSAAARLGQALRETQDALVRDNLESSASVVNCVDFAQSKSSLIDLKLAA